MVVPFDVHHVTISSRWLDTNHGAVIEVPNRCAGIVAMPPHRPQQWLNRLIAPTADTETKPYVEGYYRT
jgi:hypothetical protein